MKKTPSAALESYKRELGPRPTADRIWKEALFWTLLFAGVLLLLGTSGCVPAGYVSLDAVDPVIRRVVERHQDYVREDKDLLPVEADVALMDGELIVKELDAAREAAGGVQ